MAGKHFDLTEDTLPVVEEIGGHMPGGFFIYKAEAPEELIYANRPVFDIFGCADQEEFKELTGFTFRGMVHPEDYDRITASIAQQIGDSEDQMDYAEYRITRRDGRVRWVDDYGHYCETKTYGGVYVVFISDITEKREQRETDKAIRDAVISALTNAYNTVWLIRDVETEASILYHTDLDEAHAEAIRNALSHTRYTDTKTEYVNTMVAEEDRERMQEEIGLPYIPKQFETRNQFTVSFVRNLEGGPRHYLVDLVRVLMPGGRMGVMMGFKDVDEDVRHRQAMMQALEEAKKAEEEYRQHAAEARIKARNDFLANMSHDIRTPMNAIVGYTHITKDHIDEPEVITNALEKIGFSSHYLLSLINDILDISKIESGKVQINRAPCDLRDIFRRIEDITALQAKNKSLIITYRHDSVVHCRVNADELRIEQVLVNIISNAIKYTPEGKTVDLIAEEEPAGEDRYLYRFIVRDTGIGISEDYLPHIFESFTREEKTTVNRIQGTGLGLAITAKVVELMGGTISVKSILGEGSEFAVELELEPLEESQDTESEEVAADLSGRRVLLVEDNDINAEIACLVLSSFGMNAERAANGREGLEQVQSHGPGYYDAILMDIQMPVMNGYEATRTIRALEGEYYKTLPILAMSANAYDQDVTDCLVAGMNAHIAKPFTPEGLRKALDEQIVK